ncbi:MAG: cytochrome o ubiquinol oxidase subunit IV [Gammaproteobacteria bacterium CG11_big_fil_rev_8_21_14_0_20_46_22]|nr:MAG: cytochrome o ubiquinol oxidase subunit IV [Gammaproteobacteria bacterium CG12_big_fil_rev_8_21_14_0_65_46_12]PIR10059.1 MAG: cytochrome o ubiquinol oxidase subunit IV [Gammaproteobacteria bacterium CG11_big_fil_rev_8_21_14_0_20_46_22]
MNDTQGIIVTKDKPGRKILLSYLLGFLICAVLSVISFLIVQHKLLSTGATYIALTVFVAAQMLTQIICFLRLNSRSEEGMWNLMSFVFTIVVIVILVVGTLWIMYNLNYNMVH